MRRLPPRAPLLVLVVVAAFGCRTGDDPWLAWPEEPAQVRDARWSAVMDFAELQEKRGRQADSLERAAAARNARDDVPDALRTALSSQPGLHVDALPPATAGALAALLAWHTGDGSLGSEVCDLDAVPDAVALIDLAGWALASAEDETDPRVDAVVALAHRLGRDGVAIHGGVAQAIWDRLIDWAQARGVDPSDAWHQMRPQDEDVARVIAREHACIEQRVAAAGLDRIHTDWLASRETLRTLGVKIPDARSLGSHRLDGSSLERELAWVRAFYGGRWAAMAERPADRDAARAAGALPDRLPSSFVVRISAHDYRFLLERWYETVSRFDAYLDGEAPDRGATD